MSYRTEIPSRPLVAAFGGRVFALDPGTGERRWAFESTRTGSHAYVVRLAVTDERIYALFSQELVCLRRDSGAPIWRTSRDGGTGGTLLAEGDRLYVGDSGVVSAYDANGKKLWTDEFKGMGVGEVSLGLSGNVAQSDLNT